MPTITPIIETFPYTFPITFGKADGLVGIGDYEPVLPIEYRYTIPSIFFEQEPKHWLGFIEALQGMEELLMPIWPIEETTSGAYLYPYFSMQISTPTYLPNGTGAASPTSTVAVDNGQTSTEAV
jgi:hypothetical protein